MTEALSIILIEDNPSDAILLEEYLRFQQVKIEPVSLLVDGIRLAKSRRFDAILLDLGLPDSRGLETLSAALSALPDAIIILTGLEDEDIAMRAVAQGAQDYLVKGQIDERLIIRTIRHAIERKNAQEALSEHMRDLEKLSASATQLLEPMPYYETFQFIAQHLEKIAGSAVTTVSEYNAYENRTIIQAISGPGAKLAKIAEILGRNPVGLSFAFEDGVRDRIVRGRLVPIENGLFGLTFEQMPLHVCRKLEEELELGEMFAMPFLFDNDFLGMVAVLTDRAEGLKNRGMIEALVNQAGLALKRKRAEDALERANEELEQRVQERTADLSNAIDSLQAEVEGRILAELALRNRSNQLRELASELTLAEQRERRRMAKVLHDDLQQLLVGARFQLSPLQRFNDRIVQDAVQIVNELLGKSVEISRTLTSEMSPPILYEGGLVSALEWLGRWMQEKHGLTVQVESDRSEAAKEPDDIKVLLFEAVRELLLNVVKYAGVGTAYVQVQHKDNLIQITVKDKGRGFDPAELITRGISGGHGLFGIRERIESFGGSLQIDSRIGHGSSFVLMVPVQQTLPPEAEIKFASRRIAPAAEILPSGNHKIRVLLVDDHAVVRKGLTYLLSNEPDIEVVSEASDGEQALDLARQFLPDVLLMDINMPKMNGIEATRIIHSDLPGIHVIGLSMFEEAERAAQMLEAGAVAYVSKSGQSAEVIAAIRAAAFQDLSKR